jgi:DNA-binding CsgD family transcriptional regulator
MDTALLAGAPAVRFTHVRALSANVEMRPPSRLKDITRALATWTPEDRPVMTWLLAELQGLMRASFVGAYRPLATDQGWSLEFMLGAGERAASQVRAFQEWVLRMRSSPRFLTYNPYAVEARQRNTVLLPSDFPRAVYERFQGPLYQAVGTPGHQQVRILVCDGPRLLSWLGATREQPFTAREVGVLRHLARPLQERLRWERQLRPPWHGTLAMELSLEAVGRPAFVVGPRNTVELANAPARALLERGSRDALASIRQSERQGSTGAFTVTRLTAPGWPPYLLAIAKQREPASSSYAALAQERWRLTARQTAILELVLDGASNKEIATQSSCAEVTVENHITEIYRRSGARSRTDVVRLAFLLAKP